MSKRRSFAFLLLLPLPVMPQVIVNVGAFEVSRPLAPGSLAAAFGDFSAAAPAVAGSLPLPVLLGGVEVRVSGAPAPIYAVTKNQVNFVVPPAVAAGRYTTEASVEFRIKGAPAGSTRMLLRDVSPAILVNDAANAFRPSAALNQDGSLNAQTNPASPGEVLTLYLTGQGTERTSSDGGLPPETVKRPIVFFRTWPGETLFSGSLANQPGVWQVKVRLPQNGNLQPGAAPMVVLFDGLASNTAAVWVKAR